ADSLELLAREAFFLAFDFLQAGDRGSGLLEPFDQARQSRLDPVDVEAGDPHRAGQMPKLEPQPQPAAAFGFSTLNAAPPSDSTKSTVLPATSSRLTGSVTSRTPAVSLTESPASGWSVRSNLYW